MEICDGKIFCFDNFCHMLKNLFSIMHFQLQKSFASKITEDINNVFSKDFLRVNIPLETNIDAKK